MSPAATPPARGRITLSVELEERARALGYGVEWAPVEDAEWSTRRGLGSGLGLPAEAGYRDLLSYKEAADDGVRVALPCAGCEDDTESLARLGQVIPHDPCERATPRCVDCGAGRLTWAEGGYVPGHRICGHCGSHWDLDPVGRYRRARFYS